MCDLGFGVVPVVQESAGATSECTSCMQFLVFGKFLYCIGQLSGRCAGAALCIITAMCDS